MSFISTPIPSIAGKAGKFLSNNGVTEFWASAPGNAKSDLIKYDASVTFDGILNSPVSLKSVKLTATTELVVVQCTSRLVCAVWDDGTKTFGAPVTIRTGGSYTFAAISVSTSAVLISSVVSGATAMETVVLTITSGTSISLGTAVPTTLSSASGGIQSYTQFGSSFVLLQAIGSSSGFIAVTVSGTVPTLGSENLFAATGSAFSFCAYDSTTFVVSVVTAILLTVTPCSVSGTTITPGTAATSVLTILPTFNKLFQFPNGRAGLVYNNTSTGFYFGAVVSVAANVATLNIATASGSPSGTYFVQPNASQAFLYFNSGFSFTLNDSSGTAVLGTGTTFSGVSSPSPAYYDGTKMYWAASSATGNVNYAVATFSGNNVNYTSLFPTTLIANSVGISAFSALPGGNQVGIENTTSLINGTKCAPLYTGTSFLCASYDGVTPAQPQQCVGFTAIPTNGWRSALNLYSGWLMDYNSNFNTKINFRRVELTV